MNTPTNITQIITPEVREAILANSANLEESINLHHHRGRIRRAFA
jgi:hypothetical protein